jgi:DNA-directed RNA polymerase subunit RPC12/RpoP
VKIQNLPSVSKLLSFNSLQKNSAMENVQIKEEQSVEFVLILPNKEIQTDVKVKLEPESEEKLDQNKDGFVCKVCDKKFLILSSFWSHKKVHEPKVQYEICYKFLTVLSLRQPKKFKCEKCEKTFLNKHQLNNHLKIHKKLFKCDKCGTGFAVKYLLVNQ